MTCIVLNSTVRSAYVEPLFVISVGCQPSATDYVMLPLFLLLPLCALQVALRAPLSQAANASKSSTPVPGMSRSGSGAGLASLPPLPPVPPAAATQLLVAGPGAAPSAPLPLSGSFVAAAAAAAGVGDKPAGSG